MRYLAFIIIISIGLFGCSEKKDKSIESASDTLYVYATEVFLNDQFYNETFSLFEDIFQCEIDIKVFPNSFTLIDSVKSTPDSLRQIDVIFGIDNIVFCDIYQDSLFLPYEAQNLRYVQKENLIDDTYQTVPVSFCQLGFISNSERIKNIPSSFGEMQDGIFKNKIILLNPRTSSLGRAMLIWSVAAFGKNGYGHFWRSVKENIFQIVDNYDEAYNMFLAAQAPLIIGYSTTPVYHAIEENSSRFKTTLPLEGSFNFYLTAGIFHSTKNLVLAKSFIEFILSEDFQSFIPQRMWMFPVNKKVILDENYELIPKTQTDYSRTFSNWSINKNSESWLKRWESIMKK